MNKDTELLPCPFCGPLDVVKYPTCQPTVRQISNLYTKTAEGFLVHCESCTACGQLSDTVAEAITAWNSRADTRPRNEPARVERVAITDGLLISMATRWRHDFGLLELSDQKYYMNQMRKIAEEITGEGFYSPEKEQEYLSHLNAPDYKYINIFNALSSMQVHRYR